VLQVGEGLMGTIAETRQTLALAGAQEDARFGQDGRGSSAFQVLTPTTPSAVRPTAA
jgi:hypothetical protein